jgi:hypothetical protein
MQVLKKKSKENRLKPVLLKSIHIKFRLRSNVHFSIGHSGQAELNR